MSHGDLRAISSRHWSSTVMDTLLSDDCRWVQRLFSMTKNKSLRSPSRRSSGLVHEGSRVQRARVYLAEKFPIQYMKPISRRDPAYGPLWNIELAPSAGLWL